MKIRHAVVTAAGPDQRQLPLQRLVDRDGVEKSALRIVLEEAASGGVESIVVVHHRGDGEAYAKAAGDPGPRLEFVEQREPRGYGDALLAAREAIGDEPFLHLVGDHLYLRGDGAAEGKSCARQVVEAAEAEQAAVSAVQPTREGLLTSFGAVGGPRLAARGAATSRRDAWTIDAVLEKPTPTEAEQKLAAAGLRAGHYLCFFGIHALTPALFPLLEKEIAAAAPHARVPLSPALARLCRQERHLALAVDGQRHDLGARHGVLYAQLALALAGRDRDEVLTRLLELLVQKERAR